MTNLYVWHDSLICVTWLIYMCDMTHSYVWHDSFICVTWLIHMCDMTHSGVWPDSFICVAWVVDFVTHSCVVTHCYVEFVTHSSYVTWLEWNHQKQFIEFWTLRYIAWPISSSWPISGYRSRCISCRDWCIYDIYEFIIHWVTDMYEFVTHWVTV